MCFTRKYNIQLINRSQFSTIEYSTWMGSAKKPAIRLGRLVANVSLSCPMYLSFAMQWPVGLERNLWWQMRVYKCSNPRRALITLQQLRSEHKHWKEYCRRGYNAREKTCSAMCVCTLCTATLPDGLHRRVPAVASSPRPSEHIRTHGLFV